MDDDIVWIREEAPDDDESAKPNEPLNSSTAPAAPATTNNDYTEIPVTIQPSSTEVRFVPEPPKPADEPKTAEKPDEEVKVEIYDPTSTTVPAPVPIGVEVYDGKSTEVPVIITHSPSESQSDVANKEEPAPTTTTNEAPVIIDHKTPEIKEENSILTTEDESFDISECERKLNEATAETKDLVNKLMDKSQQLNQNTQSIAHDIADQRKYLIEDVHKTIEDIDQLPPPPELPTGGLARNVESVIIGEGALKYITGCIVLPNGTVLATDEEEGIVLFDTQGNVVKKIKNPSWRKPRSPIYYKEHILMLLDTEDAPSDWSRYIFKFTIDLQFVAKIEGPKWMRNETVISERLSIAHTDYMYLCVHGEIFSALYELTPVGQWTEIQYRLSESYIDMLAFAVVGPITQILVVEGNKNYVIMFSVRESEVVDRRRIAICERPGALARDEAGRLFVANRAAACIQLVDTVRWSSARNVALADSIVPHFSASWGLLAVPLKGAIRLHRYSFRFGCK
ncbi:unnamed protein product [Nippostrongylus brasiliensis]|uniref:CNH domain-containing protein n=1 Tax=Nippostrongylus brasiliensis TaxID=27835 RepID=A0A0N4Y7Z3_NIPBR|nr:hypothetical protein Q1695_004750 [Nippostrongylus brasiliensis]VDL75895.1 unnamed protein product [Nippostrongylus brasiliensis]